MRLYLLALLNIGILIAITYGIQWLFPSLSDEALAGIGFLIFMGFMASLIKYDYGIDWNTGKFKGKNTTDVSKSKSYIGYRRKKRSKR